jgi:hypothetical protein
MRFALTVAAVVIVAICCLVYGMYRYARFDMTASSEGDLIDRYRLVCGAYGDIRLDESRIPVELAPLVPYAKRYGHPNAIIRRDCASKMSTPDAKAFALLFDAKKPQIEAWLHRFPTNFLADEVDAFRQLILFRYEIAPASTSSDRAG